MSEMFAVTVLGDVIKGIVEGSCTDCVYNQEPGELSCCLSDVTETENVL